MFAAKQFWTVRGAVGIAYDLILHTAAACGIFGLLQAIAARVRYKSKAFSFFSSRTMVIYLLHQQLIYFTILWLNGKVPPVIHAGINFIVAIGASLLISCVVMRFKPLRILTGGKA